MALMKPSESWAVTAQGAAERQGLAARSELRLRNAMETFLRARYPVARICHEMVMGEREVRADTVAICPDHIAAVEVKGEYDKMTRLLHQAGMYQLCVPEVWLLTSDKDHCDDAATIRYLMPSLGLITATGIRDRYNTSDQDCVLTVVAEPVPRQPHPKMMLEMMWAEELASICGRTRVMQITSRRPTRSVMIGALDAALTSQTMLVECCTELRARHALWRADPPVQPQCTGDT